MILSNVEIQKALDDGRIILRPDPKPRRPVPGGPDCPYNTHSVDVCLDKIVRVPKVGHFNFDLANPSAHAEPLSETFSRFFHEIDLDVTGSFVLDPHKFILAQTRVFPTLLDHAAMIPSQGIPMMDNHHYAAKVGQVEFAKRTVTVIQQKAWFPPQAGTTISVPSRGRLTAVAGKDAGLPRGAMAVFRGETPYLVNGKSLSIVRKHAIEVP